MAQDDFTQVRIRRIYLDKLRILALAENRSMANMVEELIDHATEQEGKDHEPRM